MKKIFNLTMIGLFAFFVGLFYGMISIAQEAVETVAVASETDVLKSVFSLITDYKQMSAFAIALALTQILRMVLSLPALGSIFPNLTSKMKLVAISLLAVISGILTLKVAGTPTMDAVFHGTTLAAVQVFLHQYYKEFVQKPKEEAAQASQV